MIATATASATVAVAAVVIVMEDLVLSLCECAGEGLVNRVETMSIQQRRVLERLVSLSSFLDTSIAPMALIDNRRIVATKFRCKLQDLRISMLRINERCEKLQIRLNCLRRECHGKSALVENGPFLYKCIYKGGVRYRDYPSSSARVTGKVIAYNDSVTVTERVFITGENSIFLHVKGTGWLFENRDSLKCMTRVMEVE